MYLAGQRLPVLDLLDSWAAQKKWDIDSNMKKTCIEANCLHLGRGAMRVPSATRTK